MNDVRGLLESGHFARKQIFCKSRLIAWSHASRFAFAQRLVETHRGQRLLDYGCGDGTFIALVSDLFPDATGADLDRRTIKDCQTRYAGFACVRFVSTRELGDEFNGAFDVVTCMETLEHCIPDAIERVLGDLQRLVRPGGRVIVSVPIEIGPTHPHKQTMRAISGWRKLGDYQYRERYLWRELLRMTCATRRTAITRKPYLYDRDDPDSAYLGHKGFNWRAMRDRVAQSFDIRATRFSPLGWTRGFLSSQAWFVCEARV